MKDYLEEKLKKAIERKDEFSAAILITRLENLGYKVITQKEYEDGLPKYNDFCADDIPF